MLSEITSNSSESNEEDIEKEEVLHNKEIQSENAMMD